MLGAAPSGALRPCLKIFYSMGFNANSIYKCLRFLPQCIWDSATEVLDSCDLVAKINSRSPSPVGRYSPPRAAPLASVQEHMQQSTQVSNTDGKCSFYLYHTADAKMKRVALAADPGLASMQGYHPEEYTARFGACDSEFPFTEVDGFVRLLDGIMRNPSIGGPRSPDGDDVRFLRLYRGEQNTVMLLKSTQGNIEQVELMDGTKVNMVRRTYEPQTLEQYEQFFLTQAQNPVLEIAEIIEECRRSLNIPAYIHDPRVDTWAGLESTPEGQRALLRLAEAVRRCFAGPIARSRMMCSFADPPPAWRCSAPPSPIALLEEDR